MGLAEHRREIEEIDSEIIHLIARRLQEAKKVFLAKRAAGLEISDPEQETLVFRRAMDSATELGLDAGAVRDIFEILIVMSLEKQKELAGREQG
jgi:chorismate mutase